MQRKVKYLMITIFIILIITIIIILLLLNNMNKIENEQEEDFSNPEGDYVVLNDKIEPVKNETMYYTVSNCIQNYISTVTLNHYSTMTDEEIENETGKKAIKSEEQKKEAILSILSKNYSEKNKLTANNIYDVITLTGEYIETTINKMICKEGERIKAYGVYVTLQDIAKDNAPKEDKYFIVTLDIDNMTYCIEPIDNTKINDIYDLDLDINIDSIEKNDYNVFTFNRTSQQNMALKYISDYKNMALTNPERAYLLLDEEYRNKRYGSLEEYEKYVSENKDTIRKITLNQYQVTTRDGYTEYICIDSNNRYYIFNVTAVMEYTLILDTYTTNLPEFIEKYDKANNNQKVALNIEKVRESISCGDYKYAYNKLNETFKNNNFPTLEAFEKYIKENYPSNYEVEYGTYKNYGDSYTQEITIKDTNSEVEVSKKNTIIMKLKENRDFEMSFDIK